MSDKTSDVILASIKDSSYKQYDVMWKKWWLFCLEKNFNVFSDSIGNIIEFLTLLFEKGSSYGSLNSARSAISMLVGPHIAEDPEIKRFLKGSFNLKPTKPKYDDIWDPALVLKFFSSGPKNEDCDLKTLSFRLVTLLALITAQRRQTLSLIDIRNIRHVADDKVEIKIPDPIKTSGPNRAQPVLFLPKYTGDQKNCVVSVLDCYLRKTAELRGRVTSLFIGLKKPHVAVGGQTLSRWIKSTLKDSGVDVNIFSAHSTRHAATSAAYRNGVSLDTIRKTACWSKDSAVFAKCYNLQVSVDRSSFARSVLFNNNV